VYDVNTDFAKMVQKSGQKIQKNGKNRRFFERL
jgi:hypothetical protein